MGILLKSNSITPKLSPLLSLTPINNELTPKCFLFESFSCWATYPTYFDMGNIIFENSSSSNNVLIVTFGLKADFISWSLCTALI